jgi:hypothetical protein
MVKISLPASDPALRIRIRIIFISWNQIRIRVKSWNLIRILIKVKNSRALEDQNGAVGGRGCSKTGGVVAQNGAPEDL